MASKTRIEDTRGKIDFSQSAEPTLNSEETKTGWFFIDWLVKGINFLWFKLKDLFPLTQATTHNYIPKIDNESKKLVKSNINDNGSRVQIESPLDLNKNSINNVAIEVVSSLPTTNNFDGRQVTYEGRSYIWNENDSAWKCDTDYLEIGGRNLLPINNGMWERGTVLFATGNNSGGTTRLRTIEHINVESSQDYYLSIYSDHQIAFLAYDASGAYIGNLGNWTAGSGVLKTPSNTARLRVVVKNNDDSTIDLSDLSYVKIKLEKGNIPTDWTPAPEDKADVDHNHDGTYSTTDTKNTAGATDTSSKIYLVGSSEQSENPQTYTHDTAYVDTDGNLYSGNSKTVTNSDLETNQIVTPTLNPTWTVRNYAGTVISSPTNPSGGAITGTSIVLEYGFKPSMTVKGKWVTQTGYDNPTSCSGLCGTTLPASNVETAATSSINLYNSTTYSSTTFPITTSSYWTISTPKKGITVSGSSLVLPIGNISASARTQVTYQLPVYYGNIGSLTITENDVEGLSTKTWKNYQANSKSVSALINSSDSQYWIYAYPAAWGDLSTISNADGDWTAAFTKNTVILTGAPGLAILYNYYITVNKGAFKNKTINFS